MATTSQNSVPFSRFSRLGLGLGLKSSSTLPNRARRNGKQGAEDEWYIPYSGPYEPPRETFRRRKERDSWGDPIPGREQDDDDDTALASIELHKRYVVGNDSHAGDNQSHGAGAGSNAGIVGGRSSSRTEQRQRAQSTVSGRTVSSVMVDPSRASIATQRQSVSSSQRPPIPSYINLDAAGGVGESPVPPTHQRSSPRESNRASIAGLFTFPVRNKPSTGRGTGGLFSRKPSQTGRSSTAVGSGVGPTTHRRSSSTGTNSLLDRSKTLASGNPRAAETTDDDDYYNSYYFSAGASQNPTSITTDAQLTHPYQASNAIIPAGKTTPTPSLRHPYANVSTTSHVDDDPRTAPLPSSNARPDPVPSGSRHISPPKLTFTKSPSPLQKPASANVSQSQFSFSPFQKGLKRLKNSVSTPDLRLQADPSSNSPSNHINGLPSKASPVFRPKDRWLSAETWCDALLFPRPRLKIKDGRGEGSSGRIVSPPGSPARRGLAEVPVGNGSTEPGVVSRVLAHSRSLVNLVGTPAGGAADEGPSSPKAVAAPSASQTRLLLPQGVPSTRTDRPPRPKSWALDDLALPTPVPSLARVIEEGEQLDSQRKQWQAQAAHSFQNKRTRSISRARSKSLSQKGRRPEEPRPSNMDFLAARACLGNQLLTPVIAPAKPSDVHTASSASGPFSKSSHSHSDSLAKTTSKSSKSHSRGHSRSDSWGRSALKIAKTATCGLAGTDIGSPVYSTDNGLENALKRGGTKVIRLADPALGLPSDDIHLSSSSPTPSGSVASDARIGIALTVPPVDDNSVDIDSMRMPAHPYAQGGLYSYSTFIPPPQPEEEIITKTADHKEPHWQDSNQLTSGNALVSDPSSRHDELQLPPSISYHPYAQQSSSRDSYIPDSKLVRHPRDDSGIPSPAKMWAQLSPGVVREILPGDIQYSPFMSENGDDAASSRNSRIIYDTVGVGEALAYAVRPKTSKDSGLGTSEDHAFVDPGQAQAAEQRSYRQAVQYDSTRPPYIMLQEKKPSLPHSAHTFASSPLLHQETPPLDLLPSNYSAQSDNVLVLPPRTTTTSPESLSPPHSPRSIGNPDDLDNFYDLFYKPSRHSSTPEMGTPSASGTLGLHRRGSGLTSLARQLSEEFEQMTLERDGSQYSRSSIVELQGSIGRKPTDSTLEFVFEETSPPDSSTTGSTGLSMSPEGHSSRILPFQPSSVHIPEDVESRASSLLEPDDDETELFRVGMVESVSTPPAVDSDHRTSYTGQLSQADEQHHRPEEQEFSSLSPQSRIISALQPPSADLMRSSYMTTSTDSRMSGLSDFPAPPQRHPMGHMSLLTSYFDEAHSLSEAHGSRNATPPLIPTSFDDTDDHSRRLTFGGEDEIEELVAALSSHSHSTAHS